MGQSVIIAGAAAGALSCSSLLRLGKLRLLYILNLVLLVGVAITLIGQYFWLMCIGRFIWGVAFGSFSVVCAKFVNEISPIEYSGPFGATNQMSLCFGAALPGTLALAYPTDVLTIDKNDFYIQNYWRIIFSLPIIVSFLQLLLLSTCFRHESPVFLHEQGRTEELLTVMKKFYAGDEARKRLTALAGSNNQDGGEKEQVSIKDTFFNPEIRGAAWVGFMLVTI